MASDLVLRSFFIQVWLRSRALRQAQEDAFAILTLQVSSPWHHFLRYLPDVRSGRGSLVVAGTAGYCVGNLRIPGYDQPWEEECKSWKYPAKFASPLQIEIDASNGASDYGTSFLFVSLWRSADVL